MISGLKTFAPRKEINRESYREEQTRVYSKRSIHPLSGRVERQRGEGKHFAIRPGFELFVLSS